MTTSEINFRTLPSRSDLTLKDIIKTLPKECFQQNQRKAWSRALVNVLMVGLGYAGLALAPWYFLPLFWVFTGTGLTGFFVIAHDCGHRSFAKRRWVNDLVGHIFMMPLIYPFHGWRIKHIITIFTLITSNKITPGDQLPPKDTKVGEVLDSQCFKDLPKIAFGG